MPTEAEKAAEKAIIDEIHAIRAQIWEEIKDMTSAERIEHMRRKTAPIMAEYGLKYATPETIAELRRKARINEPEPALT